MNPPPLYLGQCFASFAVAEGRLLLDIGWLSCSWYQAWHLPNSKCFKVAFAMGMACKRGVLTVPETFRTCFGICCNCWDQFSRTCRDFPDLSPSIFLGTFSYLLSVILSSKMWFIYTRLQNETIPNFNFLLLKTNFNKCGQTREAFG